MTTIRLQKYMASCGIASRRASEKLIEDGLVCINKRLARIGDKIDPEKDEVTIKGKLVRPDNKFFYIALYKPEEYISSCSRSQGAALVDLVKIKERFFPVGRLDKNSEGLILLTNDGELANKLTHPKYECEKEYEVRVGAEEINDEELKSMRNGMDLEDSKTKPCKVYRINKNKFGIVLKEGQKRQIRRMCQAFGKKVITLKRIRIKQLLLGSLKPGGWRYLTESEADGLR